MDVKSLISQMKESGIELWLEGGRLRFKAPEGAMTEARREELKAHRDEIIACLSAMSSIPAVPRTDPLPLSFPQSRLWFLDRYEEGKGVAYTIPYALRLKGDLDMAALNSALGDLLARHESLRTIFPSEGGAARQVIRPPYSFELKPVPINEDDLSARLTREACIPFDLEKGPLFRAHFFTTGGRSWVLMMAMHHIISDGWSGGVLARDLGELYTARCEEREARLPALPIQYADYAVWSRKCLEGGDMEKKLAYWQRKLSGYGDLDFPTDFVRPSVRSSEGRRLRFIIDEEVTGRLKTLGSSHGATLYMVMLSLFSLMLARYTCKDDVMAGMPLAGRDREETQELIGFFVNTLPLRLDLSENPSFRDLLERIKKTCLDAYAHQDVPLEYLVEMLKVERDSSRTPLFQVVCVQNAPDSERKTVFPGLSAEELDIANETAKFDLTFSFQEKGQSLLCEIEYAASLFLHARIERMADHMRVLARAASDDPSRSIQLMPMLTEKEHNQLVVEWNRVPFPFKVDRTIHQIFEEQALRHPDRSAVICGKRHLTYRELNEKANQCAHAIRSLNLRLYEEPVKPDTLIGLCVDRDIEMIVGILAILKSGAAYVPLDPRYPENRLRFMAEDARCRIILTQKDFLEQLLFMTEGDFGLISLDSGWYPAIERCSIGNPENINSPGDLAYVIYTSGSTGKPKGALLQHYNVIRLFNATDLHYQISERDIWSCFHSYAFDFSVWEIWGALLYGGCIVIVPYDVSRDTEQFHSLLHREGVTVLSQTPSAFFNLMEVDRRSARRLDSLRYVVYGGENLDITRLRTWWERYKPEAPLLVNMYGITETTVHATYHALSPSDLERRHVYSPIGTRLHDLTFYVLDEHRNPVPIATPGELYVGGDGLARGYFNRPELTTTRFMENPFARAEDRERGFNTRLYKSGDLVRWIADGTLEYIGRSDFQVKIRGFRIELGEIETVLGRHPSVAQCIVLAREDGAEKRLVAYYTVKKGEPDPSVQELRSHLGKEVADYMVPAVFVPLASMPLTENGKIDRKALPVPKWEDMISHESYTPPVTDEEKALASLWQEVLGIERVGIHDNFFSLGGNSITSIQMVYRAREKGIHISPRQIFVHPTIEGLAGAFEKGPGLSACQGPAAGEAPLTPIQHWFFGQHFLNPHHFNQAMLLRFRDPLDTEAAKKALEALASHHDSLRLRYRDDDKGHWNGVYEDSPKAREVTLEVMTIADGDEAFQQQKIEMACTTCQRSLGFCSGPMIKALAIKGHRDGKDRLLIVIHHLVVDALSWSVLLDDLQAAFTMIKDGKDVALPEKTGSFKDWGEALLRYAASPKLLSELSYWRDVEDDPPVFPAEEKGKAPSVSESRIHTLQCDEALTAQFLKASKGAGGAETLLLSSLLIAAHRTFRVTDLIVHMEGHGREDCVEGVDVSRTVGWFTSLYPLRLALPSGCEGKDDAEMTTAVGSVAAILGQVPNRGIGYGVLRYLGDEETRKAFAGGDRAQVAFNYLGVFGGSTKPGALFDEAPEPSGYHESRDNDMTHLLDINCAVGKGRLTVLISYSTCHFSAETVDSFAGAFREALSRASTLFMDAVSVDEGAAKAYEPVSSFNEKGTLPPLFFLHPGQGGAETYFHFSTLLENEQPFYALESYNLYSGRPLIRTIQAMAAHYVHHLRAIQPKGPYYLGGWCLGGLLSLEIASQLRARGQKTEVIYCIDTFIYDDREKDLVINFADRELLLEFLKTDPLYYRLPEAYRERLLDASVEEYRSLHGYAMKEYDGEVVLFKALLPEKLPENTQASVKAINEELTRSTRAKPDNGLGRCMKNLTVVPVEANHHTIMEGESIACIAKWIEEDITIKRPQRAKIEGHLTEILD